MAYSSDIYESWRKKQWEKYEDLFPKIKNHLKREWTVIDIGIGPGWLEELLWENGFKFRKIVGVEPDKKMVERKPYIKYHITQNFRTREKFDFLICFDTVHLIDDPIHLLGLVKKKGHVLFSVPMRFKKKLDFLDVKPIKKGMIGKEEKDYFIFAKV
jgi:2-polyprenyl-3-methyl-5-hydroxy-6-metoxy-1,4-benzoquinol methylase